MQEVLSHLRSWCCFRGRKKLFNSSNN